MISLSKLHNYIIIGIVIFMGILPFVCEASFLLECDEEIQVVVLGEAAEFEIYLTNTGSDDDVYWLSCYPDEDYFPEDWSMEFWIGDESYPDTTTVELEAGEELEIIYKIITAETPGYGYGTFVAHPISDPDAEESLTVTVVTADISVDDEGVATVPQQTEFYPNFPNPFNPETTFRYALDKESFVSLKIYDTTGNLVDILVETEQSAGEYRLLWSGEEFSSGAYYALFSTENFSKIRKLILLK